MSLEDAIKEYGLFHIYMLRNTAMSNRYYVVRKGGGGGSVNENRLQRDITELKSCTSAFL
jgi:hypothetical protein